MFYSLEHNHVLYIDLGLVGTDTCKQNKAMFKEMQFKTTTAANKNHNEAKQRQIPCRFSPGLIETCLFLLVVVVVVAFYCRQWHCFRICFLVLDSLTSSVSRLMESSSVQTLFRKAMESLVWNADCC